MKEEDQKFDFSDAHSIAKRLDYSSILGKVRIDDDIIDFFMKRSQKGPLSYGEWINKVLRDYISNPYKHDQI